MADELVFYTNPQSRGLTTHWMLEEIGCPYRMEIKAYGPEMKAPDYLAINPMGKVPAIKHGDTVVTETGAILCYLADAFPAAKLAPPVGRARRLLPLAVLRRRLRRARDEQQVGRLGHQRGDAAPLRLRHLSAHHGHAGEGRRRQAATSRPTISPRPISSSPRS